MSSRTNRLPVEESWRVVDGDNDSFETSILPGLSQDDILLPLSSEQPSSGFPSQLSSQSQSQSQGQSQSQSQQSQASQDSIRDFATYQEDEQVILRQPFRPSVSRLTTGIPLQSTYRTPEPEFKMPLVDFDDERKSSDKTTQHARSTATNTHKATTAAAARRKKQSSHNSTLHSSRTRPARSGSSASRRRTENETLYDVVSSFTADVVAGIQDIDHPVHKKIVRVITYSIFFYIVAGIYMLCFNLLQSSPAVAFSALCRIPGMTYLDLSLCPGRSASKDEASAMREDSVSFTDIVEIQIQFERILEKNVAIIQLPERMKLTEDSLRHVATLVETSELPIQRRMRNVIHEYNKNIAYTVDASSKLSAQVGSTVDAIISANKVTLRQIKILHSADYGVSSLSKASSLGLLFYPFRPIHYHTMEHLLRDRYIEHGENVADRTRNLESDAQKVEFYLKQAADHLFTINELSVRANTDHAASPTTRSNPNFLTALWNALVADKSVRPDDSGLHVTLLRQIEAECNIALEQIADFIVSLQDIVDALQRFCERVQVPPLSPGSTIPSSRMLHSDTINTSVERLVEARKHHSRWEAKRVQAALAEDGPEYNADYE